MQKARILVVDDDKGIVRQFTRALESEGYRVESAHSGEEAWKKYKNAYFDIVLTDWQMGGMDGMHLLEGISRNVPRSQVIMITGHYEDNPYSAVEAHHRHAFDYLKKPVDLGTLFNTIEEAVALRDPVIEALEEWVEEHQEEADEKTHIDFSDPPDSWSAREILAEIHGNTERGREEYKDLLKLTFHLMTHGNIDTGVRECARATCKTT